MFIGFSCFDNASDLRIFKVMYRLRFLKTPLFQMQLFADKHAIQSKQNMRNTGIPVHCMGCQQNFADPL